MTKAGSNQRIKFAYRLNGWTYEDGNKNSLRDQADKVLPSEYTAEMEGEIFCPGCYTNLIRVPKDKEHFSNGRDAYFAHMGKYKEIKCDLRTKRPEGKRYDSYEEAQKAIDDENLVIISGFLQEKPERPNDPAGEYDETPVEDQNGPQSEVPISRHNGESFALPSKITTVAGICRGFDNNLYKYYHLPGRKHAVRLDDLLKNIQDVVEEDEKPKFYFGEIKRSFSAAKNPEPYNIRMTELISNADIADFYLKSSEDISQRKGIHNDSVGKIVIMYGKVTENGIGLSIERLKWGEFSLLPQQYNNLLNT
jgi:hypothetical protein